MNSSARFVAALLFASARPAFSASAAPAAPVAAFAAIEGKVAETMNAAGYTYVLVDTGQQKVWIAATALEVKAGDRVVMTEGMPMANYHSKTLNRTFEVVYFTDHVTVNGKTNPPAAAAKGTAPSTPAPDLSNIKRADGGQTIAEVYAGAPKLTGRKVALRGRVVKYNGGILGKNWLHLRDGSGAEGTNDLTITSLGKAKVGDLVVVTGTLAANRDFGGGYHYPLIVEDATLVVE